MKALAIETTDIFGSIAAGEYIVPVFGSEVSQKSFLRHLAEYDLPTTQRSAQSLVPSLEVMLREMQWSPSQLEVIVVGTGPGSFTGLRVGVTTAKILAWSTSARIIGVETPMALAMEIPRTDRDQIISFGIDAQRGEVAVQRYFISTDPDFPPIPVDRTFSIIPVKKWLEIDKCNDNSIKENWEKSTGNGSEIYSDVLYQKIRSALEEETFFCGSILKRWKDKVSSCIQNRMLQEEYWKPRATGILKAGFIKAKLDQWNDLWTLLPLYSRLSTAEERLNQKQSK